MDRALIGGGRGFYQFPAIQLSVVLWGHRRRGVLILWPASYRRVLDKSEIAMTKPPKRPRDLNQWAKHMVDLATGEAQEPNPDQGKDAAGRRG